MNKKLSALLCGWALLLASLLDALGQSLVDPILQIRKSGPSIVLSWTNAEYRLESTTELLTPSWKTDWELFPGLPPVSLPAADSLRFFRLSKPDQVPFAGTFPTTTPWAILLCRFKDNQSDPPVPDFRTVCDRFFTPAGFGTYNAVRFFSDMSHGSLDLSGSQVLGWYVLDVNVSDVIPPT